MGSRNAFTLYTSEAVLDEVAQGKLAEISLDFGYVLPVLCTPNELMGD
ncbi:hypothetical protein [Planktothricoides raciborskii]|uniref:Uncharacterized protein n=1 Tax=Planktothricoides raciborskii FACHB-1370 TaxID=2949576 RepID=A0ABR8EA46_9CYAN|nr:hypothetical protein [Planktothricoides raciborskii FACHB-1370]MBD2581293.1 hypothetical protein [Planktothricoides raciborskii FACHB-1261]